MAYDIILFPICLREHSKSDIGMMLLLSASLVHTSYQPTFASHVKHRILVGKSLANETSAPAFQFRCCDMRGRQVLLCHSRCTWACVDKLASDHKALDGQLV